MEDPLVCRRILDEESPTSGGGSAAGPALGLGRPVRGQLNPHPCYYTQNGRSSRRTLVRCNHWILASTVDPRALLDEMRELTACSLAPSSSPLASPPVVPSGSPPDLVDSLSPFLSRITTAPLYSKIFGKMIPAVRPLGLDLRLASWDLFRTA